MDIRRASLDPIGSNEIVVHSAAGVDRLVSAAFGNVFRAKRRSISQFRGDHRVDDLLEPTQFLLVQSGERGCDVCERTAIEPSLR